MRIVKLQRSASSSVCNIRGIRLHCFRPCTHFYFSLPTEKFLRGQGEKYTWAEKDIPSFPEFPPVEVLWPLILVFCPFHIHLLLKRLTDL